MSKKISVHVDLMKSDKELEKLLDKCTTNIGNIAKKAANNYEKQLLQYAIREKAKQVYVVRKIGVNIETSCYEINCQFFTDKEVACTYARMNKSSYTCEIIGHELGKLANLPDDVFESIPDDGNKDLAVEYRRVMREEGRTQANPHLFRAGQAALHTSRLRQGLARGGAVLGAGEHVRETAQGHQARQVHEAKAPQVQVLQGRTQRSQPRLLSTPQGQGKLEESQVVRAQQGAQEGVLHRTQGAYTNILQGLVRGAKGGQMKYEELANEKISIFGYSEPLVPYERAMEACRELVKERKKALERVRELTVENAKLKESLPPPSSPPEEDGSTSTGS